MRPWHTGRATDRRAAPSSIPLLMLAAIGLLAAGRAGAAPPAKAATLPSDAGVMAVYNTQYYAIHTDLGLDESREAAIRMARMVEEYRQRTREFSKDVRQQLPFYLFANPQEYNAAGGPPGTAGVFLGNKLMATTFRNADGSIASVTWHVVQHEGFHQFVAAVIGGDMPPWLNEGMAEYFGEAVFTGDSFVTGLIPQHRLTRVREAIRNNRYRSVEEMMKLKQEDWNTKLTIANYDQAWSMVYFLAHGEDGKYQKALVNFMHALARGIEAQTAWNQNFGNSAGFEQAYEAYWLNLPPNPTADGYTKALVLTLSSFLARAQMQKQSYDRFDEFLNFDATLAQPREDGWLPPTLFINAVAQARQAQADGCAFELVKEKGKLPAILCTLPDGRKIAGRFTLRDGVLEQVFAEMPKPPAKATTKPTARASP